MKDPLDRLTRVLARARLQAERIETVKRQQKQKSKDKIIADDYAERLLEKATYRRLLSDELMDGLRFRWYCRHADLDLLRIEIDRQMEKEREKLLTKDPRAVVPTGRASSTEAGPEELVGCLYEGSGKGA